MIHLKNKSIYFDSDILSAFLEINRTDLLENEFSQIIISDVVKEELFNPNTPQIIKSNLQNLLDKDFVEVIKVEIDSDEFEYIFLFEIDPINGKIIGEGESATIALAILNEGVVASNNLKDICVYINKYDLSYITIPMILVNSYNDDLINKKEADDIWVKMLNNGIYLPDNSFSEYFKWENIDKKCKEQHFLE